MTTPRQHAELAAQQSVTDELRLAAKSAAPYSTAMIGASHLNEAADTIDTLRADLDRAIVNFGDAAATVCDMRAQLAEAQRDAERWSRATQCARLDQFGDFVVTPDEPAFASDVSLAFTREIDAAIDAAKGEPS